MSIEDAALRFEGLDPATIDSVLADMMHFIGVVKAQVDQINAIAERCTAFAAVVKSETPRMQKMLANIQSQIQAYEANQRRYR
jgi:uncharacterized protein YukE